MSKLYKLILVDDEDEVRGRIASQIDESIGFEIVGRAGNGHDALELIEELRPDIVLTDIKMPFVNGIELARVIRREYPMIRVAFITGYDEFNYAQEAVELNVVKYLMKPVTSTEINTFLHELKASLDKEYKEKQDLMLVKERYDNLLPVIGDSFLSSLIYENELNEFHMDKLLLYGIDAKKYKGFQCCLVRISDESVLPLSDLEQIKMNINEMVKSVFSNQSFLHTLLIADGLLFVFSHDHMLKTEVESLLIEFLESVQEFVQIHIKVGVSSRFDSFTVFPTAYQQSKRAIGYTNRYDFGSIVYHDEMNDYEHLSTFIDLRMYSTYDQLLQYGDDQALEDVIFELRNRVEVDGTFYDLELLKIEFGNLIIYLSDKANVSFAELSNGRFFDVIQSANDYDSLFNIVKNILFRIRDNDIRKQLSRSEQLIHQATSFIENNYQDNNLSLELLSTTLNVSFSHLSMIFKKHSGVTFSSYLIRVRMDKAKEMLLSTNAKINDIANMCGYSDVYYFSHSFKKYVGISPKKFREQ